MRAEPTGPNASPLDPAHAVTAIEDASDRQQIFDLLLRAARSKTRFAAVLSVHADHIRGRSVSAEDGFDCTGVTALRIPRHTVAAFETAIASGTPSIGPLATGDLYIDGFLEALGGSPTSALLLPVSVGTRTIALVAAHRGELALTADEIADLFPLMSASNRALARVLEGRSTAARPAEFTATRATSDDGYEVEVSVVDIPAKRAQLEVNRQSEAWPEAVEAIRELIRDGMDHGDPDEDEQLELLLELGRIEIEQLGRPDRALEALRSAQAIDGSDSRVLDALDALYVQQGRWIDCVELLEKRVALADGHLPRIALLLNLATLAHEKLGDHQRATTVYERILTLEPAHEVASRELGKLYTTGKQWQPLAELLLDRASRQGDVKALELVARIYQDRIEDPHAAFLVWLAVFRRDPERPQLLEELARAAAAVNAWEDVIPETRALAEHLEPKVPAVAAGVWQLVGTWSRDRLGHRDEAVHALDRASQLNPSESGTLAQASELLRSDQRWTELIALLTRRAQSETDPKRRSELHAELGEIYEAHLGQPGEAIAWFERAAADDPQSTTVLVALHRLYLDAKAWDVLGELVPKLIDALAGDSPRSVMVDLHVELGMILADHLELPDDALEAYRDALALDPKHAPAFQGIAAIYTASGQTEALLEISEAEVDATSPVNQQQRYADIASAWYEYARLDRAATCWQKVLALDPRNLAAHKGLARALQDDEQWAELAVAQRAHLRLITEPFERTALLLEHAALLETKFDNVDGAIVAYQEVLKLDANNYAALDALGRLYDRAGQWQPALDMLNRLLSAATPDRRERGELLQRIGQVHVNARDAVHAESILAEAITLDPNNAKAREGMARVQLQQGKLASAGENLLRAAQLSANQSETLRLLADAAWVYRYRLDDAESARACLQRILELDPEHADAKQAIAELLHDTQEWESLWPLLEQHAERAKADDTMANADRLAIVSKAARCALELAKFPTALELYNVACSIDQSPAIQLERAEALYRSKALDAAAAAFQTIVTAHATTLDRNQLFGIYRRLAGIQAELGKVPQALTFHRKALDLEPTHRGTLEDLTEIHLARSQFDEAIASLRTLAESTAGAERIAYLERIGDLYRDKQSNAPRAMSTYMAALELDKANRRILQRILDLQSETGQWKAAVDTINRFIDVEGDHARRGAYLLASAEIRRTHLKDVPGALECYDNALDQMFREEPLRSETRERGLDAFHALRELVTADADWKYLEQCYRRMIKRIAKDDPILVPLWDALGEVYRTRLEHHQSAVEAFEIAHAIDPDKSAHRARVLAELYARLGTKAPAQVTGRAAKLVEVDPMNADAYRALGRASLEAGRIDEAWCVARALVFLKQANTEEKALYRRFQSHETRKAKGILDEDAWAFVRHADEDLAISSIFALTWQASVALRAGPAKAFNLKAKERLDIEEGSGVVAKIFKHASRVLNVALPDVYVQPRRSGRLLLANCIEKGRLAPAVIVGRDLMTGYRDTEIASSVGAMLALLRPAYYLKLTLATVEELEVALTAAAQVVGRKRLSRPEHENVIASLVAELQKNLTRATAEAVLTLVNRLPDQVDLARWRNAVDAAAQRAGLVISGDLAAAARMIASEATATSRPSQRVQELVAYSVSPAYFALRQHLAVAVE